MDREEFGLWKLHPATIQFFSALQVMIGEGLEELASGVHSQDSAKTYLIIGKINGYKKILEAEFIEEKE